MLGKTYASQFKIAFLDKDSSLNREIIEEKEMFWARNQQDCLVVIVPFMVNRNGLTKNIAIQNFGARIRQLIESD